MMSKLIGFSEKYLVYLVIAIKVVGGLAYGWVYSTHFEVSDSWTYYDKGQQLLVLAKQYPRDLISMFLGNGEVFYHNSAYKDQLDQIGDWNSSGNWTMIKIAAVLSSFTYGYYGMVVIWAALQSLVLVLFYKLIKAQYNFSSLMYICLLAVPSILFWTSGFHKDGLTLSSLLLLFSGSFFFNKKKYVYSIGLLLIGVMLLFAVREFFLFLALPYIVLLLFYNEKTRIYLLGGLFLSFLGLVVLLFAPLSWAGVSFKTMFANQQQFYYDLGGGSFVNIPLLDDTAWSYVRAMPSAFVNSLFRPYTWEAHNAMALLASVEIIALLVAAIVVVWKCSVKLDAFLWCCIFIALASLLLIGWLNPNLGTIVRYKTPFMFLLLLPLVVNVRVKGK